ncbi:hypothetical protein ACLOJK_022046 [Asimina triloba]
MDVATTLPPSFPNIAGTIIFECFSYVSLFPRSAPGMVLDGTLLARNPKLELKDYVREIRALEAQARECYADKIGLKSEEFVGMMVLDGCFLVEMFKRIRITNSQYDLWVPYFISHDMLLLENQLPFCILNRVFCLVEPDQEATSMKDLQLLPSFAGFAPPSLLAAANQSSSLFISGRLCFIINKKVPWKSHVICKMAVLESLYNGHLMHKTLGRKRMNRPDPLLKSFIIKLPKTSSSIRSAEELQEAGIEFKRKEWKEEGSFLDIQFDENGVLEIPHFYFSDNTTFQNLIAYEQCYPKAPTFFTGYASFMDDIINTAKDIQILRYAGILEHGLGSDEELAGLFNQMNKGVFMDPEKTHLYGECKAINEFCATSWHTYRANLMRNYFYNPWAILSLAAAILLLLLTVTQTVFSIYPNV